jgi:hypothetical protein
MNIITVFLDVDGLSTRKKIYWDNKNKRIAGQACNDDINKQ